jgi:aspartate racemase
MKKSIGIVGGAGPMVGGLVFNKIIKNFQGKYGFYKDEDFPLITLISFPFSDMLTHACSEENSKKVAKELREVLAQLDKCADIVAIACNTLHNFFKKDMLDKALFVNMVELTQEYLQNIDGKISIFCTSTSRKHKLYNTNGSYPKAQDDIDEIIDDILRGKVSYELSQKLGDILKTEKIDKVILGCTELSLLHDQFPLNDFCEIIDPLDILVDRICELSI